MHNMKLLPGTGARPGVLALERLRQKDRHELRASLVYTVRHCLRKV